MQYLEKVINILIELKNLGIDISVYVNAILNKLEKSGLMNTTCPKDK